MIELKENQMVISGFPGTGKSHYINYGEGNDYIPQGFAADSDSSTFDKANFPQNYIEHIKGLIAKGTCRIFVSSHSEVREALFNEGIYFHLVYPKRSLKSEYLKRYKERGSSEAFIKLISDNWDNWLDELEVQKGCRHHRLNSDQFIYDLF